MCLKIVNKNVRRYTKFRLISRCTKKWISRRQRVLRAYITLQFRKYFHILYKEFRSIGSENLSFNLVFPLTTSIHFYRNRLCRKVRPSAKQELAERERELVRDRADRCPPLDEEGPGGRARGLRSYAQQRVIIIDVEQRPMIAGRVTASMIVRVAAEVPKNPVGGAS